MPKLFAFSVSKIHVHQVNAHLVRILLITAPQLKLQPQTALKTTLLPKRKDHNAHLISITRNPPHKIKASERLESPGDSIIGYREDVIVPVMQKRLVRFPIATRPDV
jgi:hypothetical protein